MSTDVSPKSASKRALRLDNEHRMLQGQLPLQSDRHFEQANPILRSNLFRVAPPPGIKVYDDWVPVFSVGSGEIQYTGPVLLTDHEEVWTRLLAWARGQSLTKPVPILRSDLLRDLGLCDSGTNYAKLNKILDDLSKGQIKIKDKHALANVYKLLSSEDISKMADGGFFKQFVENRLGLHIKYIAEAIAKDEPVEITIRFIEKRTTLPRSGRDAVNLDPLTCLLFDAVHTTLVPYEVRNKLDAYGRRLLTFIASHRDGVNPILLEKYYMLGGYNSDFEKMKRKFKAGMIKRLEEMEAEDMIEPGWSITKNREGAWIVAGLKPGSAIRVRAKLVEASNEPIEHEGNDHSLDLDKMIFDQAELLN